MNSVVVSGTYKAVGAYGDYAIYEKQSMDANSNWWFFYYDTFRNGWEFHYEVERVIPGFILIDPDGVTFMGTVSSSNKPGEL